MLNARPTAATTSFSFISFSPRSFKTASSSLVLDDAGLCSVAVLTHGDAQAVAVLLDLGGVAVAHLLNRCAVADAARAHARAVVVAPLQHLGDVEGAGVLEIEGVAGPALRGGGIVADARLQH